MSDQCTICKAHKDINGTGGGCVMALFFLVLLCMASFGLGAKFGRSMEREKAVEADVAEWQADPKTGCVTLVYRTK